MTRKPVPEDSIGGRLIAGMAEAGLTNEALAQVIGVDPATVSQWRTNRFPPSPERMTLLEDALLKPRGWLRYGAAIVGAAAQLPALGGDTGYPRAVEGMVKRLEADIDDAAVGDDLRHVLHVLVRHPEQTALYREAAAAGQSAELLQARIARYLTAVRTLVDAILADRAALPPHEIPNGPAGEPVIFPSPGKPGRR